MLAAAGDTAAAPIPVAIETGRGLLPALIGGTGRPLFVINPLAASRYRDRVAVSRKKSDQLDARVLANVLRTDAAAHRPVPADSELAKAIAVLARAQTDAVGDRTQAGNKLRSHLREYYPGYLACFATGDKICAPVARTVLRAAPTPADAAGLSTTDLETLLRAAGRCRGIAKEAARIHAALAEPQMRQPPLVEKAMGTKTLALLGQLDAACQAADDLEEATGESFAQHPDAAILTSFPGLGPLTGARVLAELGDDKDRFADARAVKAYAGAAPVTRASGRVTAIHVRKIKNNRLAAVGYVWTPSLLNASPGARAHYDHRREDRGEFHAAAARNLYNKMLGCLHHCLHDHALYDEATAFPTRQNLEIPLAA